VSPFDADKPASRAGHLTHYWSPHKARGAPNVAQSGPHSGYRNIACIPAVWRQFEYDVDRECSFPESGFDNPGAYSYSYTYSYTHSYP
jgi:hypothetical protein